MKKRITAIVSFCTNDYRFLTPCISELSKFCSEVWVVVADHFYDGTEERRELLALAYREHPHVKFAEIRYDTSRPYGLYCPHSPGEIEWIRYWHSTNRYVGSYLADQESTHLLFVDVDELIDSRLFAEWLEQEESHLFDLFHFSSYSYLKEESLVAKERHNTALMIKKSKLEPELLFNIHERPGFFYGYQGSKKRSVRSNKEEPMVHHYNWVRSLEELQKKVVSWGHRDDKDWLSILNRGAYHELTGLDYERVTPRHHLLQLDREEVVKKAEATFRAKETFSHVYRVTQEMIFKTSLAMEARS